MNQKAFFAKYKDPRWQKRRLEVMQANCFTCEICGDDEKTLNVHHKYYIAGNDPWDYNDRALSVCCEDCHKDEHADKETFELILKELKHHFTFADLVNLTRGIAIEVSTIKEDYGYYLDTKAYILEILDAKVLKNLCEAMIKDKKKKRATFKRKRLALE